MEIIQKVLGLTRMMESIKYGCVTASVRICYIFSTGEGSAVRISDIFSTDEAVQYMTTKTAQGWLVVVFIWKNDILQTVLLQPRFCPSLVVSRCC